MEHGSASTYVNHHCRCDDCKEANTLRVRQARERRTFQVAMGGDVPHGRDSTYSNYGCRCDPCREAHRAAMRRYKVRARVAKRMATPSAPPITDTMRITDILARVTNSSRMAAEIISELRQAGFKVTRDIPTS